MAENDVVTARLEIVAANNLSGWLCAEEYIRSALEYTDEWLWQDVLSRYVLGEVGLANCWKNGDVFAALIYEILDTPRKRYLHVHLFGADDHCEDYWQGACLPQLLAYARTLECDAVTGECRDHVGGWVRKLNAEKIVQFKIPLWNGTSGDEVKI